MKDKCPQCDEKLATEMEVCPSCGFSEKHGLPLHTKIWKVGWSIAGVLVLLAVTNRLLSSEGCNRALDQVQASVECSAEVLEWRFQEEFFAGYTLHAKVRLRNNTGRKIRATIVVSALDQADQVALSDSDTVELGPNETRDVDWHNYHAHESRKNDYRKIKAYASKVEAVNSP